MLSGDCSMESCHCEEGLFAVALEVTLGGQPHQVLGVKDCKKKKKKEMYKLLIFMQNIGNKLNYKGLIL